MVHTWGLKLPPPMPSWICLSLKNPNWSLEIVGDSVGLILIAIPLGKILYEKLYDDIGPKPLNDSRTSFLSIMVKKVVFMELITFPNLLYFSTSNNISFPNNSKNQTHNLMGLPSSPRFFYSLNKSITLSSSTKWISITRSKFCSWFTKLGKKETISTILTLLLVP